MPLSDLDARRLLAGRVPSVDADYRERGIFQDRFAFGRSPAVVVVDFAYGWTDQAYAGGSRRLDGPVEATRILLEKARAAAVPVVYTTSPWRPDSGDQPFKSAADHSPAFRAWDECACRIDERIAPLPGDLVLEKENASAFFGTHLAPYLIGHRRRYSAHHRMQHERVHPSDGHGRKELSLPPDHRARVRGRPLGGRTRMDLV